MRAGRQRAAHAVLAQAIVAHAIVARAIVANALLASVALAQPGPAPAAPASAGAAAQVQAGVRVAPDTVSVGDPFVVTVRVRLPRSATIVWPTLSDSTAVIAPRAPMTRRVVDSVAGGAGLREESAQFEVAAWDTGAVATEWPPALVIVGVDTVPIRLADARVYVRTVLPPDTSLHVPRPAKPPFAAPAPWWARWWPLLVAALLVGAWLLWRRWRAPARGAPVAPVALDAFARAEQAFERVQHLALTDAGEPGRAVTLALEILRRYLTARVPRTSPAQTSAELLAAVATEERVPGDALRALLVAADTVKYAGRGLPVDTARRLVEAARALVREIETRDQAMRAKAARDAVDDAAARGGDDAPAVRDAA